MRWLGVEAHRAPAPASGDRNLQQCLAVYESEGDTEDLGAVHSAIAGLESRLQHFQEAVRRESTALRLEYSALLPRTCAISHFNLANYLIRTNAHARSALAHRQASALISYQTNDGELPGRLDAVRDSHLRLDPAMQASYDIARTRRRENTIRLPRFEPSIAQRQ